MAKTIDQLIKTYLLPNWQRKFIALFSGLFLWVFVHQTIHETKTLVDVPIRVVNIPENRTIKGLLPNGYLKRRVTLNITGSKKLIDHIEPGDIEVRLDATNTPIDWKVVIQKKNLASLNPHLDLLSGITRITNSDLNITLSRLITAKVPITINASEGHLPPGYQFLGVWPHHLEQTISGPEELIQKIKMRGIELRIDLSDIKRDQLESLRSSSDGYYQDEISFFVPVEWKRVKVPKLYDNNQLINDPAANDLRVDILRKEFIPLKRLVPIRIFYPPATSDVVNPQTYSLATNEHIIDKEGITILNTPLLAGDVSRLFLDVVRDSMEISIVPGTISDDEELSWYVNFVQPKILEDRYVEYLTLRHPLQARHTHRATQELEDQWRERFRSYMHSIKLYKTKNKPLEFGSYVSDGRVVVDDR